MKIALADADAQIEPVPVEAPGREASRAHDACNGARQVEDDLPVRELLEGAVSECPGQREVVAQFGTEPLPSEMT